MILSLSDLTALLGEIKYKVGEWGQIEPDFSIRQDKEFAWLKFEAPSDAKKLYLFSQYVSGWLSSGTWKIFKSDDSSFFDFTDIVFLKQILFGEKSSINLDSSMALLFEFNCDDSKNEETELLIANLIFAYFLFGGHGQIVSNGDHGNRYLSIQDGFIYFLSNSSISTAEELIERFQTKNSAPQWINKILESKNTAN